MNTNEIKPLNLAEVIGNRKYTLDVLLVRIISEALYAASIEGLRFVKTVLDLAKDVDLPDARRSLKMALLLFQTLTPEQIAELQKPD